MRAVAARRGLTVLQTVEPMPGPCGRISGSGEPPGVASRQQAASRTAPANQGRPQPQPLGAFLHADLRLYA